MNKLILPNDYLVVYTPCTSPVFSLRVVRDIKFKGNNGVVSCSFLAWVIGVHDKIELLKLLEESQEVMIKIINADSLLMGAPEVNFMLVSWDLTNLAKKMSRFKFSDPGISCRTSVSFSYNPSESKIYNENDLPDKFKELLL